MQDRPSPTGQPDRLDAQALRAALLDPASAGPVSLEVAWSVDSTNAELWRRSPVPGWEILLAEQQTAGRGRLGRDWHSEAIYRDTGVVPALTFSLGLPLAPREWSGLSLAVGVAMAQALQPTDPNAALRIGLKWPNDLWLTDDRKLGGILIETANLPQARRGERYVIIGMGVNIQPPVATGSWATRPASLQELDPRWSAPLALAQLLPLVVRQVLEFADTGFAACVASFARLDLLRGRWVHTSDGIVGQALGVGPDGALHIQTEHGVQTIHSAEVSVRPQNMPLP